MKLLENVTWQDVFQGWEAREALNPGWIKCAQEKGWPNWQAWRSFNASQFQAETRSWQRFVFESPMEEIPNMLLGPYESWQRHFEVKNQANFAELLQIPQVQKRFLEETRIQEMVDALPFTTEWIGLIREDSGKIVCLDGHHRATAFTLAKQQGRRLDFKNIQLTIALALLPTKECDLLERMRLRGTAKTPPKQPE